LYLPEEFDYINLMGLGRQDPEHEDEHAARVAVLGFSTTQYYASVLRGLGKAVGFPVVTFEPEYNTVHQMVLDDESPLYSFRPDFVVFLTAVQALRSTILAADPAKRTELAERETEHLVSLVRRVSEDADVTVVVNEFVIPYERAWGNFTARIEASLPNIVRRVNERLREVAAESENVYTVDSDHIASWLGKRAWFDERLWFYSKSFSHPEALPHVAGQALDIFRALRGKTIKCVALDLDNTLWGGTIGDDGLEGIRLGELGDGEAYVHFQTWLKELAGRGVLLAICSKNDPEKAREPFQKHNDMVLTEASISCFVANWDNKADNLHLVAKRLNIGLDSIVFLDDSAFERNLVRELVPDVCVPEMPQDPADFVPYLESLNLFETTQFSDEDRRRTDLYRANVLREDEQARFTNVDDYLNSLAMEAAFERFDDLHLPRIAQLVQRTNQFNLTTIRHSPAELKQFADDSDYFPFYITLTDRFGDNGLISVVICKREDEWLDVVTWLMSCRVISRRVEEFVLDRLVEVARDAGLNQLRGRYLPTQKNKVVSNHYQSLGFRLTETLPDGSTSWHLTIDDYESTGAPIRKRVLV
jgi:FkbH-like protein